MRDRIGVSVVTTFSLRVFVLGYYIPSLQLVRNYPLYIRNSPANVVIVGASAKDLLNDLVGFSRARPVAGIDSNVLKSSVAWYSNQVPIYIW